MERPRVAVGATMLAAAIDVDAGRERNVRAVVVVDDSGAGVGDELRARRGVFAGVVILEAFAAGRGEAIRRIRRHAAAANLFRRLGHGSTVTVHEKITTGKIKRATKSRPYYRR